MKEEKPAKTRILIVDDHRVVLGGIRSTMNRHPDLEVVGEATNGREGVRLARTLRPDIVIMDISMPDLNGIDAALQLKKADPRIRIIIFTMHSDREYVVDLLRAGVSAYVLKEEPMSDLLLAVDAVRRGGSYFGEMARRVLTDRFVEPERSRGEPDGFEELSLREREVLQLLAEGNSIKDVASKLDLSPKTVESHKYSIMDKLGVHTVADLTRIAIRRRIIHVW